MPKVREILKHVTVEVAKQKRTCHRDRKNHAILKGEPCLVIQETEMAGSKNYCKCCARPILDQAKTDLAAFEAALLSPVQP